MIKLIVFILTVFSSTVFAEPTIETIQINHRLPDDILPEVNAFLPENATARAFNNMIIIKAEPNTINEVRKLINKLDTPAQALKLTLLKTTMHLADTGQSSLQANVEIGENTNSVDAVVKYWSTQGNDKLHVQYQAQGVSGLPIKLNMGQLIPQAQQDVFLRFNGDVVVQNSTTYIPINNGFEAIANLLPNNQVSIEIYPQFSHFSKRHGTIDHSQLITTINGPAATWLELAQINTTVSAVQDNARHYQTHQQQNLYFYIKLEPLTYK